MSKKKSVKSKCIVIFVSSAQFPCSDFHVKLMSCFFFFFILQNEREIREVHSWSLVSERLLYRDIQPGTMFQLRQGDVSLLCQVTKLPHFHLSEEIIDHDSNKFVLRINSETSV